MLAVVGLAACGSITESASHYAERVSTTPSTEEVAATVKRFETAFREKRDVDACKYLTPRSAREFMAGTGGQDPGNLAKLEPRDFKKACALMLAIRSKGIKVPRVNIDLKRVEKSEFKGRYYLIAYPEEPGPSVVLNSANSKIMIMAGPEEGE